MTDDQIINPNHQPSDVNPWIAILYKPRAAIRQVLDTNPEKQLFLMPLWATLVSIPSSIISTKYQMVELEKTFPGIADLGMTVGLLIIAAYAVLTYLFYILHIYAFGWIYRFIGSRMNGEGTTEELRAACVWSILPIIYYTVIMTPFTSMFSDPASFEMETFDAAVVAKLILMMFVGLAVLAYLLFIHVKCVAEAHRFSAWSALGVVLLTMVLGMALLMGLVIFGVLLIMILAMSMA